LLVTFARFTVIGFTPFSAPLTCVATVFGLSASAAPPMGGISAVYTNIRIYVRIVYIILVNTGLAVIALTKILEFFAFQGSFAYPTGIDV